MCHNAETSDEPRDVDPRHSRFSVLQKDSVKEGKLLEQNGN